MADLALLEFALLRLTGAGGESFEGLWMPQIGVEAQGVNPGRVFGHEAYATLRRLAWKYRAARNDEASAQLDVLMQVIGERVKARPGVVAADVDRVIACLKADRCGCDRCRYGV